MERALEFHVREAGGLALQRCEGGWRRGSRGRRQRARDACKCMRRVAFVRQRLLGGVVVWRGSRGLDKGVTVCVGKSAVICGAALWLDVQAPEVQLGQRNRRAPPVELVACEYLQELEFE